MKVHRLLYQSTLGLRVLKKREQEEHRVPDDGHDVLVLEAEVVVDEEEAERCLVPPEHLFGSVWDVRIRHCEIRCRA